MELVEVDVISAEATKRVVAGAWDIGRARPALAIVVDRPAELGGDQRAVATAGEGQAEEFLAAGRAVDVGGVEQSDPGIERGVDDLLGGGFVDPPAEVVASEADDRRVESTDGASLHGPSMAQAPGPCQTGMSGTSARQDGGASRARAISCAAA